MRRRDFIIGSACLAASVGSYALIPRRHVSLLAPDVRLQSMIPQVIGEWTSRDVSDLIAPKIEGSLVSKLYDETVGRVYTNSRSGIEIMALLAHGDTQSDDLQLHRPEICYPAFGFLIAASTVMFVNLSASVTLPSRQLVAEAPDRRETIIYWSRLGEFLPLNRSEQQMDRLRTALHGDIADGLLARFSILGADVDAAVSTLRDFIPRLVRSVAIANRPVLIGSARAASLSAISA
jgi:EpsI family protein